MPSYFVNETIFSAGGVLVHAETGHVFLICKKTTGEWLLPKGKMKAGEKVEQTAEREVLEETGYKNSITRFLGVQTRPDIPDSSKEKVIFWFRCLVSDFSKKENTQEPNENFSGEWFEKDKAISLLSFKNDQKLVEMASCMDDYAVKFLGQEVTVKIDRPLGSKHPKHNFLYEVNYGFVPETKAPDGEEIDAYVLGINEPVENFTGKCVAVIRRLNDVDDKLIIVPKDVKDLSDEKIKKAVDFQERFFTSVVLRPEPYLSIDNLNEWMEPSDIPESLLKKIQEIPKEIGVSEKLPLIRKELFDTYGKVRNKASSFADSRFTPVSEMIERKLVSCGPMATIFARTLRSLEYPVKMIHGILDGQDSESRHAWLRIYDPIKKEWLLADPTRPDFKVSVSARHIKTYHDWGELKADYEKGNY